MIVARRRHVSVYFFVALFVIVVFVGQTLQKNREVAERRLIEPVKTIGVLLQFQCTSVQRGARTGYRQPYMVLKYKYLTNGKEPTQHLFVTKKSFDTDKACEEYKFTISKVATIWYEKSVPEKASLYEKESFSYTGLYGLILAVMFVIGAVFEQIKINKDNKTAQDKKRELIRSNRRRKA